MKDLGKSAKIEFIAGSSNGRTTDFGSVYHGSNPCPAAQLFIFNNSPKAYCNRTFIPE